MAKYTCDLAFTVIFRKTVEVDSEEEAEAILDKTTVEDAYSDHEWSIDPYEFEKDILSCDEIVDEPDDDEEEGQEEGA